MPSVQASEETKAPAPPQTPQELVDEQLKSLDLTELKQYWEDITNKYGGFLPESQKGSLYDFIKGREKVLLSTMGEGNFKLCLSRVCFKWEITWIPGHADNI